ncbi:MAG: hypothetical protein KDA91_07625, partial [Planctomycetaceae bacterium]|nr:hypothetical protein [Planctomycetaceae bacterium]
MIFRLQSNSLNLRPVIYAMCAQRIIYFLLPLWLTVTAPSLCALEPGFPFFEVVRSPIGNGILTANDVAAGRDGLLAVATSEGLLTYDGEHWQLINPTEQLAVWSVQFTPNGLILAGMTNDFGYVRIDPYLGAQFESIRSRIVMNSEAPGRCIRILVSDQYVAFCFSSGVVFCPPGDFE